MESQTFLLLYFLVILKIFIPECAGSPVNEPLSAHNDSMLERDINSNAENTQINTMSNITSDNNNHFSYHTIVNLTNERGGAVVQTFCNEKYDDVKKNLQFEGKIDEVIIKKLQESNLEKSVLLEKKIDELMGEIKEQQTNMQKVLKMLNEIIVQKNNSQASSLISKQANCDDKSPAFTGSSYLAIYAPERIHNFSMSMEVKATEPVTDGIIMYCAESVSRFGGFMSLAVHQGRLEFRFLVGWNFPPLIVLTADRPLPANEWTNIEVTRVNTVVSLRINSGAALEGRLSSTIDLFRPDTPLFIGGVDGSTVLHNDNAVSGGFKGCIKGVKWDGVSKDIVAGAIKSANVQKYCDIINDE